MACCQGSVTCHIHDDKTSTEWLQSQVGCFLESGGRGDSGPPVTVVSSVLHDRWLFGTIDLDFSVYICWYHTLQTGLLPSVFTHAHRSIGYDVNDTVLTRQHVKGMKEWNLTTTSKLIPVGVDSRSEIWETETDSVCRLKNLEIYPLETVRQKNTLPLLFLNEFRTVTLDLPHVTQCIWGT